MKVVKFKIIYSKKKFFRTIGGTWVPSRWSCPPGTSPRPYSKTARYSFCIFLNLLNPLELPIPLVALLELEKLTAIQLGCVLKSEDATYFAKISNPSIPNTDKKGFILYLQMFMTLL